MTMNLNEVLAEATLLLIKVSPFKLVIWSSWCLKLQSPDPPALVLRASGAALHRRLER